MTRAVYEGRETWLEQPVTQLLNMDSTDVRAALELLRSAGTAGNLTADAKVAAIALRQRAVVHTAESDFTRFPTVRWHNPLSK